MPHAYRNITIEPAGRNAHGFRWYALVDLPCFAGWLRADTLTGMRDLIDRYSKPSTLYR